MTTKFRKYLDGVDAILTQLGVNNPTNALRMIKTNLAKNKQYEQYQTEVCKLLNVDNIGNAIKRLKTLTTTTTLPLEFQQEPDIWLTGSNEFSRMDYKVARKEYRALLPTLVAVYSDIISEPDLTTRKETLTLFRECFERSSPDTLYRHCRNYLFDSYIEIENNTNEEEPCTSEVMNCLNEVSNTDYGVRAHS